MIYVISKTGKPIMPTTRNWRIGYLLRKKKDVVIRKIPFTVKLIEKESEYTQEVSLGVDCWSKHIGLSATTSKKELFSGQGELRTDIVELLSTRRESRRTRRNKLRYRKARFLNRVKSKKPGWVAPSVRNKIDFHKKLINFLRNILPISKIILEIGSFDSQLMKNPEISGKEYQEGERLGFWNTRDYILFRDKHTCQYCKGKSGDNILEVHHIESRKTGGNSPSNLITLCKTCHTKYHRGEINIGISRNFSLRDASYMNIMKNYLYKEVKEDFSNTHKTFGYYTKYQRISSNLPKSHNIDARVISGNPLVKSDKNFYVIKQIRRHNRKIHKSNLLKGGRLKKNQAPYLVKGFRLFDQVIYLDKVYIIQGRRSSGYFLLVNDSDRLLSVSYKKLRLYSKCNRMVIIKKELSAIPPSREGILAELS